MSNTAEEILFLLDLDREDTDLFLGRQPRSTHLEKVYGGQMIAQALVAANHTVSDDRVANSLHAECLAPGSHDSPLRLKVERVRDGRSFSSRAVRAFQGEREVLRLSVSYHVPEAGLAHQIERPEAPSPEETPPLHEVMESASELPADTWRAQWEGIDVRYVPHHLAPPAASSPGIQQLWVKVVDPLPSSPRLHREILTYLSDHTLLAASLVPHGFMLGAPLMPRATLNHSMWFHDDVRADEWFLIDQRSPWAGEARGLTLATVHTQSGRHVATMGQEGLIRPQGELRSSLNLL